jgi:hypothetical protein
MFTDQRGGLEWVVKQVFYPHLVGGILPGIAATISYYVCAPVIRAYQTAVARRCAKLSQLKNPADAE